MLCPHFKVPEHMVELLRQLGGQVIACCSHAIPLPSLLAGDVAAGITLLEEVRLGSRAHEVSGGPACSIDVQEVGGMWLLC